MAEKRSSPTPPGRTSSRPAWVLTAPPSPTRPRRRAGGFLFLFITTHIPPARLLPRAGQLAQAVPAERLLAVDEPRPVTLGDRLPYSGTAVQAIASLFPTRAILQHEHANRGRLLEELPKAQIVHFSCHGTTNWEEPAESGLLLASDTWLTVRDLSGLPLGGARLAGLSACETRVIRPRLPDGAV